MAVVTPLNNPGGPEGDTVTMPYTLLSPKSYYNGALSTKLHVNMRIVVYTGVQIGMWYLRSFQMDNHCIDSPC